MKTTEELAREAGIWENPDGFGFLATEVELERFRDLIRNEVLEEAALACSTRAHTYSSENANRYMIQDDWGMNLAQRIRALKKDLQSGR